jgi:serpin B
LLLLWRHYLQFDYGIEASNSCAHNAFGFRLFSELTDGTQQSVVISPVSVALALSIANNGATGETQRVMDQALQLQGMSLDGLNHSSAALIARLNELDSDIEICVANSLWVRDADLIAPAFRERSAAYYHAELHDPATSMPPKRWPC